MNTCNRYDMIQHMLKRHSFTEMEKIGESGRNMNQFLFYQMLQLFIELSRDISRRHAKKDESGRPIPISDIKRLNPLLESFAFREIHYPYHPIKALFSFEGIPRDIEYQNERRAYFKLLRDFSELPGLPEHAMRTLYFACSYLLEEQSSDNGKQSLRFFSRINYRELLRKSLCHIEWSN